MENHIAKRRAERGMTQEELAGAVGVTRQTIISLERGRYNPSLLLAVKLARQFGCAVEELFVFGGVYVFEEETR